MSWLTLNNDHEIIAINLQDDGSLGLERTIPEGYPETVRWDATTLQFVPDLDKLRNRKWNAVKARQVVAEHSGCSGPLGIVQTDSISQLKIAATAVEALSHPVISTGTWSIDWKMTDNTYVTHSREEFLELQAAVRAHVTACHVVAQGKQALIMAANTEAEVDAVDLETGWPVP